MKVETCSFSGRRINPGHGVKYVKTDNRVFFFLDGKSESMFLHKHNPRKISWTLHYRKAHKKGLSEDAQKRRTRRTHKMQRAIVGASLDKIRAQRHEKPEVRAAAREASLREIKEAKRKRQTERRVQQAAVQKQKIVPKAASKAPKQRVQVRTR